MPQSLHAELAEAAEREEVSLNQYITNTFAAGVGWHTEGSAQGRARAVRERRRRVGSRAAIVTNIVIVVIAGVIALILLVVALSQGL